MGGGGGDGVTDTRTQKAEETKGLQSSEWPRPHHSLLSLGGARCGSVSEDEKTFLSWSPNVSVCVVYVFLVTVNSHVQISCSGFKIYFLTGRYGNANRPFLVLLTGSHITATTFSHSLLQLCESKQAWSLRGRRRSWRSPLLLCGDSANRSRLYPCILTFSVFLHRLPA